MEFLQFILTIGVVYQATSIISESSFPIFKWLQKRKGFVGDFFGCFLCVSVWVGWIGSVVLFDVGNFLGYESVSWAISGLFYSFIVWFIHLIEGKLN